MPLPIVLLVRSCLSRLYESDADSISDRRLCLVTYRVLEPTFEESVGHIPVQKCFFSPAFLTLHTLLTTVLGGKKFSLKLQFKNGKVKVLFFHSKPYRLLLCSLSQGSEKRALVLKNTRAKIVFSMQDTPLLWIKCWSGKTRHHVQGCLKMNKQEGISVRFVKHIKYWLMWVVSQKYLANIAPTRYVWQPAV